MQEGDKEWGARGGNTGKQNSGKEKTTDRGGSMVGKAKTIFKRERKAGAAQEKSLGQKNTLRMGLERTRGV